MSGPPSRPAEAMGEVDPLGAVRAARAAGFIEALGHRFAETLGRLTGEADPWVLLAAALAVEAPLFGDACLELGAVAATLGARHPEALAAEAAPALPPAGPWRARLARSRLVADARAGAPLVLWGERLYIERYWRHQESLVAALRARLLAPPLAVESARLRSVLDEIFPSNPGASSGRQANLPVDEPDFDRQRLAATLAATRGLTVVTGGPGTGKTTTVVRLLAVLLAQAGVREGARPPRIVLLAPTGKAAARLAEAVRQAQVVLDPRLAAHLPVEAATLHRALGARPGSTRLRHGPDDPLAAEVVVVDEASMIDLALMSRLFAALRPETRLVLLGDRAQLASVEAGAVLADLCQDAEVFSPAAAERLRPWVGPLPPRLRAPGPVAGIADVTVALDRTWRFESARGIGALAAAINAGDAEAALRVLADPEAPEVTLCTAADPLAALGDALFELAPPPELAPARTPVTPRAASQPGAPDDTGSRQTADQPDSTPPDARSAEVTAAMAARALDRLGALRVLCAHRDGPGGVRALNAGIERWLADRGRLRLDGRFYPGRPVMVIQNDYLLGLFNGDVGITLDGPEGRRVWFPGQGDGGPRAFGPARLPNHETVFATTVHKAQGSEFEHVVVVLPPQVSPLVTRELLYTAVTRARSRVTVVADPAVLRAGVAARVVRASGLGARLAD